MPHVKRQKIKIKLQVILATLLLVVGFFVSNNSSQAAIGLQIGTSTLILNNGENLMYGNINGSSDAGSNLLLLKNASSPKFLITSSGNVGIGTTGPGEKLDVLNGNIQISGNGTHLILNPSSGLQSGIGWKSPGLSFSFALNDNSSGVTNQSGSSYGGYMLLNSTAGSEGFHFINKPAGGSDTEAFTIQGTTGNVGIGATNPGARLDIVTTDNALNFRIKNDTTGGIFPMRFENMIGNTGNSLRQFVTSGNADTNVGNPVLGWITSYAIEYSGAYAATIAPSQFKGWQWMVYDGSAYAARMNLSAGGNLGIGTTAPNDIFSIGNSGAAPAGSAKTGHNFTSTYLTTDDYALVNYGIVKTLISSGSSAFYSTSTPTTSLGTVGSYTAANALCSATVTSSHVCTSGEILNTITAGQAGNIPVGSTLWINNGPPAYTANANDCIGWTSSVSTDFGAVWNRPSGYADGFGSLNRCNIARKFACCK